jgi:uncharacterized membrane protein YoaK (UPF0700 family)
MTTFDPAPPGTEPRPAQRSGLALLLGLSLIAGLTDVTTFILLDGIFSAHITGNLVVLAADLASGKPARAATALAIPVFAAVAAVTAAVVGSSSRPANRWVTPLLAAQFVLIAAAASIAMTTHASTRPASSAALLTSLCAVTAMAVQSALLHVTPSRSGSTAVMTGNIVSATVAAVGILTFRGSQRRGHQRILNNTWPLIAGFIAGCGIGALACQFLADTGWVLATLASFLVVGISIAGDREGERSPVIHRRRDRTVRNG